MNKMRRVSKYCSFCGRLTDATLDADRYNRWQNGELIQDVFPELPIQERETLISGTCADCQKKIFG